MCGIAGFAGIQDRALLEAMADCLAHRGPDDRGFFHEGKIGLGSRRLSILDLAGGRQPRSGDRGPVVVFNGEICNFQSLRRGLERSGHRFASRSDTEVIVHLYEERGVEAFSEMFGMFAVAIWDPRSGELILARDHLGVKPLYFAVKGERLYFGSEIKSLRKVSELELELDPGALAHYMDYLYVPCPRTIYRNVRQLAPGEWLRWKDGKIETGRFWRPELAQRPRSRADAAAELDDLLRVVVKEQSVADVPMGIFLSGGLDSSAIAYYLKQGGSSVEAYCAYFPRGGERFNELDKALKVASVLGLNLHPLPIHPDIEGVLDDLVTAFDEPLADSSALPNYWVSREARRHVKVALSGVGGDELFGGYTRYRGAKAFEAYRRLPLGLRSELAGRASRFPESISSRNIGGWARRFFSAGLSSPEDAYSFWMGHLSVEEKRSLFSPAFLSAVPERSAPREAFDRHQGDLSARILAVDLETYLPDDLLTLADRTSMAASLELRVPLCDPRLVEFSLSLPSELRVRGCSMKPLLQTLLKDRVPGSILRQKKQGFMVPLGNWFKDTLRPLVDRSIEGLIQRGLFQAEGARRLADEHRSGARNRTDVLWAMVVLERWFERNHPGWRLS